jgi:hypothetical protein
VSGIVFFSLARAPAQVTDIHCVRVPHGSVCAFTGSMVTGVNSEFLVNLASAVSGEFEFEFLV